MTDKPSEKETDAAFQRTLERLVKTPPKPHKGPQMQPVRRGQPKAPGYDAKEDGREPKPAPKD